MNAIVQVPISSLHSVIIDADDMDLIASYKWRPLKNAIGKFYAVTSSRAEGKVRPDRIPMHRLLCGLSPGDSVVVDHINGDGLDNRRSNLRVCTMSENCARSRSRNVKATKYRGVYPSGKKSFRALVQLSAGDISLGIFRSPHLAALAYNKKIVEIFGEFATTNRIDFATCKADLAEEIRLAESRVVELLAEMHDLDKAIGEPK